MINPFSWLRGKAPVTVDVAPGRQSQVDQPGLSGSVGRLAGFYDVACAGYPIELLEVLERLSIFNPDISQACKIMVNLGNTGHEVEVSGGRIEAAVERLNYLAANLYRSGGGVDGLVNHFMRQIPLMGALSAEFVIADKVTDGLCDVAVVPVRQIRFRNVDGEFKPYQYTGKGMGADAYVELNTATYSYAPLMTLDGSPYGVPLFLAAVKNIEIQLNGIENLDHILKKFGLVGFFDVSMTIPDKRPQESDVEYRDRLRTRLSDYAKSYQDNFNKGMAIHYEDQEIKHNSVSGAAGGAVGLFNLNEEQICSGLDLDPSLLGRSYSTTETYAEVAFARLVSTLTNIRRVAKRFIEKGYALDLALTGIKGDVSLHFNPNAAFNEGEAATAADLKVGTVIKKRDAGFIDDDEAARELGYEEATGERVEGFGGFGAKKRFAYDARLGRYVYLPEVLEVGSGRLTRSMADNYLTALRAVLAGVEELAVKDALAVARGDFEDGEEFAAAVWQAFEARLKRELGKEASGAVVSKYVADLWQFHRHDDTSFHLGANGGQSLEVSQARLSEVSQARLSEVSQARLSEVSQARLSEVSQARLSGGIDLGLVDKNALRYLTMIDDFYLGKGNYLADHPRVGKKFINWLASEYIGKGLNIKDGGAFKEFERSFPTLVEETAFDKVEQLVRTTVARVQNFGQTMKLYEIGAVRFRIAGPRTAPICEYCKAMVGRVFEVEAAAKRLAAIVDKGFESVDKLPGFLPNSYTIEEVEAMTDAQLQAKGFESPPYHPKCRHRKVMED